jgi:hypothetical protein
LVFPGWIPLLCALSAFSQSGAVSVVNANANANQIGQEPICSVRGNRILSAPGFALEYVANSTVRPSAWAESFCAPEGLPEPSASHDQRPAALENNLGESSSVEPPITTVHRSKPADFNRAIYYRNKLEFSLEGGWLPINIPFPLDIFVGDAYNTYPLKYTLVPIIASLRWQLDSVGSPWILRGNWDLTFSGSVTAIPRGPETRYFSYDMGIRRNFVQRNWRVAPYFDIRLGVGNIDAKGPQGVLYAQGEDLTFTVNMGSGVRYNFNPRYAISAGLNFMHISNLDLSEGNGKPSWGVRNYGINVYGPMVGIDIRLGRPRRTSVQ